MCDQNKKNLAHSIFQRLLNRAKNNKEDFNLLLSRYGMERFLYRLSVSSYNDRFILKGARGFQATYDTKVRTFTRRHNEARGERGGRYYQRDYQRHREGRGCE